MHDTCGTDGKFLQDPDDQSRGKMNTVLAGAAV